jgi:hypothetical protein
MNYDTWKAHNPADEFLGPEPDELGPEPDGSRPSRGLADLLAAYDAAESAYFFGEWPNDLPTAEWLAEIRRRRQEWLEASASVAAYIAANRDLFVREAA